MNNKLIYTLILLLGLSNITYANTLIQDELVNETLLNKKIEKPAPNLNYNFEGTDVIEIRLLINDPIKSEKDVYEGQPVTFRIASNVHYKGKILVKRHTLVPAKVEVIITSGMNGIPASIIFGSFDIKNLDSRLLTDFYEVRGQDRSLMVYPLKWALTILPPSGTLTNFIKGGHAKLKTNNIIKLYYHPNWDKTAIQKNEQKTNDL